MKKFTTKINENDSFDIEEKIKNSPEFLDFKRKTDDAYAEFMEMLEIGDSGFDSGITDHSDTLDTILSEIFRD